MSATNENFGVESPVPADATSTVVVNLPQTPTITQDGEGVDPAMVIGDPAIAGNITPANVCVYADGINPVSYMGDAPIVTFDVVFSVAITCPVTNTVETYKVVKRIGVDRLKMAECAKMSMPVAVLEQKQPIAEAKALYSASDMRRLAGVK